MRPVAADDPSVDAESGSADEGREPSTYRDASTHSASPPVHRQATPPSMESEGSPPASRVKSEAPLAQQIAGDDDGSDDSSTFEESSDG